MAKSQHAQPSRSRSGTRMGRETGRSVQVVVRVPRAIYDRLIAEQRTLTEQILDALRAEMERRDIRTQTRDFSARLRRGEL